MDLNIFILAIIVANIIISYKGFSDVYFFRKYEFHIGSIRSGDQIRMVSSGFLHGDIPHLAFNMITLYFFAPIVCMYLSSFSFLLIYFGSLIFGSLLTLMMHKNDYSYRAIGASGAVTGIIYSAILLDPNLNVNFMFIPIDIPGYIFGVGYLLYSIYGMKAQNDNIGHTAHFGGAIGGYLITLLKAPVILSENLFLVVVLAIPIVILYFLTKAGKL
ncbi:rhomboid family intramembrane serine protease [Flavobacterium sp.]|uniref:rhomboid family intramembrane serine protease n=1 Tax=Flavobacterium sp. TaxID=239 RepID=UPI002B4B768A|nr:rhomboid family intramembrane serine protease [Flavobacterium sp.]HLP63622.1 rhomboid family intramembrane serine protease [Flavobacterium sp.]